jgi:transcriptional regulator of acetoin/glycerol metabolism
LIADLLARPSGRAVAVRFTCEAAHALLRHGWPSNVRELAACLVVASALARGGAVQLEHLPEAVRSTPSLAPADAPDDDPKRAELVALLTQHGGNVSAVARAAHRSRVQVHRWLRRFGLDAARFRR